MGYTGLEREEGGKMVVQKFHRGFGKPGQRGGGIVCGGKGEYRGRDPSGREVWRSSVTPRGGRFRERRG